MNTVLLGCAHVHADSYAGQLRTLPGVTFTGIFDADPARGHGAARRHGVAFFPTVEEALRSADAAVVASSTIEHRLLAAAAAAAGKHVLCEKPLATTLADAEAMIAAAGETGVVLATAFPMRFAPPVTSAFQAVRGGAFGRVLAFSGANNGQRPSPPWFSDPAQAGGGAVLDHTVHLADLMRWFIHDEVEEVYAEVDTLLSAGAVEDVGILSLRFRRGVAATIDASWNRPGSYPSWGGLELRIVAEHGVIDVDAFAQRLAVYGARTGVSWPDWGSSADRAMLQAFVSACRGHETQLATGKDGREALRVALMAYESARTHSVVVADRTDQSLL